MKFSIITPSYQQGQYLRQNIESVQNQNWRSCEHIVIDGGSNDETVDILKSYPHLKWVSEADEGQADALNKGLRVATGDIVGWINSDDYYLPGAFHSVAETFSDPSVKWVIGDIALYDERSSEFIPMKSTAVSSTALQMNPDILRQQGTFFRREFLEAAGGWNKAFFMAMDFDLWLRLAKQSKPHMLPLQLAVFRVQKDQKSNLSNLLRQSSELALILNREGASALVVNRLKLKKTWYWLKGVSKILLVRLGLLNDRYLHRPCRGWGAD